MTIGADLLYNHILVRRIKHVSMLFINSTWHNTNKSHLHYKQYHFQWYYNINFPQHLWNWTKMFYEMWFNYCCLLTTICLEIFSKMYSIWTKSIDILYEQHKKKFQTMSTFKIGKMSHNILYIRIRTEIHFSS